MSLIFARPKKQAPNSPDNERELAQRSKMPEEDERSKRANRYFLEQKRSTEARAAAEKARQAMAREDARAILVKRYQPQQFETAVQAFKKEYDEIKAVLGDFLMSHDSSTGKFKLCDAETRWRNHLHEFKMDPYSTFLPRAWTSQRQKEILCSNAGDSVLDTLNSLTPRDVLDDNSVNLQQALASLPKLPDRWLSEKQESELDYTSRDKYTLPDLIRLLWLMREYNRVCLRQGPEVDEARRREKAQYEYPSSTSSCRR